MAYKNDNRCCELAENECFQEYENVYLQGDKEEFIETSNERLDDSQDDGKREDQIIFS